MDCKFEVQGLKRILGERLLFSDINFTLSGSERLFVTGPSGVGKTLFLRLLACLDEAQGGELRLNGKTPSDYGFPAWRALVTYVPQSRVNFKGTPAEFYFQAQQFASQKGRPRGDLPTLINDLGLEHVVLNQAWTELSGGQAQRVAIAIAVALRPAVLLLDEPTSACDQVSVRRVEKVLKDSGCALIWISHDPEQPSRLGGKVLELPGGTLTDIAPALLAEAGGGSATSSSESELSEPQLEEALRQMSGIMELSEINNIEVNILRSHTGTSAMVCSATRYNNRLAGLPRPAVDHEITPPQVSQNNDRYVRKPARGDLGRMKMDLPTAQSMNNKSSTPPFDNSSMSHDHDGGHLLICQDQQAVRLVSRQQQQPSVSCRPRFKCSKQFQSCLLRFLLLTCALCSSSKGVRAADAAHIIAGETEELVKLGHGHDSDQHMRGGSGYLNNYGWTDKRDQARQIANDVKDSGRKSDGLMHDAVEFIRAVSSGRGFIGAHSTVNAPVASTEGDRVATDAQLHHLDASWTLKASYPPDAPSDLPPIAPGGLPSISMHHLLLAVVAALLNAGVSFYFNLGMHLGITVSIARMVLQVMTLGLLLVPVFSYHSWWLVLLFSVTMLLVAAVEIASRPAFSYDTMLQHCAVALGAAVGAALLYCYLLVLPSWPVWQSLVPLLGVLLSNMVTGMSAALSTLVQECIANRDRIEVMLALGASRTEALTSVVKQAIAASLSPLMSQMSLLGLVGMPSLMAGQMLQGQNPMQASRLQLGMMLLSCGANAVGCVTLIFLASWSLVDDQHMLVAVQGSLRYRPHGPGTPSFIWHRSRNILSMLWRKVLRLYYACCIPGRSSRRRYVMQTAGPTDETDLAYTSLSPDGETLGERHHFLNPGRGGGVILHGNSISGASAGIDITGRNNSFNTVGTGRMSNTYHSIASSPGGRSLDTYMSLDP